MAMALLSSYPRGSMPRAALAWSTQSNELSDGQRAPWTLGLLFKLFPTQSKETAVEGERVRTAVPPGAP